MKKYLLFAGSIFYATGGMKDFVESFDTIKEAKVHFKQNSKKEQWGWMHIVSYATLEIVFDAY